MSPSRLAPKSLVNAARRVVSHGLSSPWDLARAQARSQARAIAALSLAGWLVSLAGVAAVRADAPPESARATSPPPPVGVRFGETLEGRRLRVGYSWERIQSRGLRVGDDSVSPDVVLSPQPAGLGFARTPRSLELSVHTFELAYAPHPRVTLIAQLPFVRKELETLEAGGLRRQDQTKGLGDVGLFVLVPFIRKGQESSQVHIGFDAPTGAIRRGGDQRRLPYISQIGNGTWDFEWGWTYRGAWDRLSWGGQAIGRHPLGRNGLKYRHGSHFAGTVWGAVRLVEGLGLSFRSQWEKQNNFEGFDRSLRASEDPSENGKLRGGEHITLYPGVSLDLPVLGGQRIAVEVGIPVHQRLDGPQLERDWSVKTAWQWVY